MDKLFITMSQNKKNRIVILLFLICFSSCKIEQPVGLYSNAHETHMGITLTLIQLDSNHNFLYHNAYENDDVKGTWVQKGKCIYLYSSSFKHKKKIAVKDMSYFLANEKDSTKAMLLWMDYYYQNLGSQYTDNDSADVFRLKKDKLLLVNPIKRKGIPKVDEDAFYFKRISDSAEYNYLKRLGKW